MTFREACVLVLAVLGVVVAQGPPGAPIVPPVRRPGGKSLLFPELYGLDHK